MQESDARLGKGDNIDSTARGPRMPSVCQSKGQWTQKENRVKAMWRRRTGQSPGTL